MPEACGQSLARLTAGHGEQRRLGMFSRLVSPTLSHYLLQRCCNCRILQQRLATWRIHGELRDCLGKVLRSPKDASDARTRCHRD
jgi:hypothetical protein